jgi:hypothetical protein
LGVLLHSGRKTASLRQPRISPIAEPGKNAAGFFKMPTCRWLQQPDPIII